MIHFILVFSRQGQVRLERWFNSGSVKGRSNNKREVVNMVLRRKRGESAFIEWKGLRLVYKRYASLFFCFATAMKDNELITLELMHRYVELLDRYFGNVCELDLIFKFDKAMSLLDELFLGGELCESNGGEVLQSMRQLDVKLAEQQI